MEISIPRGCGWEDEFYRLFLAIDPKYGEYLGYGVEFENSIFATRPYYWGDCTCGVDFNEETIDEEHKPECAFLQPNFLYKPSGLEISWYKYPLRGATRNRRVSLTTFKTIIDDCIKSLGG